MLKKMVILGVFGIFAVMVTGCEREEPAAPTTEPPAAPAPPPATTPPDTTQAPQAPAQQEPATTQQEPSPAQEPPAVAQQEPAQPSAEKPAAEKPAAATPAGEAPEQLTFEARNGTVTFPHGTHASMFDCSSCHPQSPPAAIPDWGRERAHELCIGCHKSEGAGPTQCNACHVKG